MDTALSAAGGLGIFLLAMAMMTDGLKIFGGDRLRAVLQHWTSRPIKAAMTGAMVTGLVQSSSAVTVATIGFANAGILTLRQSLGVIFGANVGTTVTGWLVSLVGFGFNVEKFALPIIALGMALRVAVERRQIRGLGEALTGFGLFLLGLTILKTAFSGVATAFGTTTLNDIGSSGVAVFALVGIVATILTQSSSAAIALILTAASESAIGLGAAAAAIIGTNVGTTSTAAFAVIKATANARRVAAGHILFNACTGVVALVLLPFLLWGIGTAGRALGLEDNPTVILALFHTTFNILGVVLLLPFVNPIAARLERLFRTEEEDISRPRHLDSTVARTPALAILALRQELRRMHGLVVQAGLTAIERQDRKAVALLERRSEAILQLGHAVREFAVTVHMEGLSERTAESLPHQLRISRYLEASAHLLSDVFAVRIEERLVADPATKASIQRLAESARSCLRACAAAGTGDETDELLADRLTNEIAGFQSVYQQTKAALLHAAAANRLSIEKVDLLLDATSGLRRMVDQLVKASLMLLNEHGLPEETDDGAQAEPEEAPDRPSSEEAV